MNAELIERFQERQRKLEEYRDLMNPMVPLSVFADMDDRELDWALAQARLAHGAGGRRDRR
jgi:hypothetical protein